MNRRQLLGRFLIKKIVTKEEAYNKIEKTIEEYFEFKELVKKMRKAQKEEMILDGNEGIEFVGNIVTNVRKLESEVDKYLKIN